MIYDATPTDILAAGTFLVFCFIIIPLLVAISIGPLTDPKGRFGRFRDFR